MTAAAALPAGKLDRMRRAVSAHAAAVSFEPPRDLPPIEQILRGEWHETPLGPVFARDEWFAFDHLHGSRPLESVLASSPEALAQISATGAALDASRLAYFDIETTGLSGGTGTYVVVAGLGSFERDGFRLRQYFLADIGGERAMLAMLANDLARFDGVVTYNGRAFDIPFVETRLALSRLPSPCARLAHLDLLHTVRRLYKHRMSGCRLAEAERRLLRLERPDDLPGSLIPSLYFDYVRAGRVAPLRAVLRHNADDVLSLTGVLAATAHLFGRIDLGPEDAVAVARWWELVGQQERAIALYRAALPWLEGEPDWAWAAARHAALCKRAGLREEAVALWRRLWERGDSSAGLELAKHLEHKERNPMAALEIATALPIGERGDITSTQHRIARLLTKLQARN